MHLIGELLLKILDIYTWLVIAWVIFSWLQAFNVVNTHNRVIYMIGDFLNRITEPALRPIRRIMPNLGAVDLSPLVLILVLWFLQRLVVEVFF